MKLKEIPIPFKSDLIKAIWNGYKTQTRRIISKKYIINDDPGRYKFLGFDENFCALFEDLSPEITPWLSPIKCPYKTGDHLWVKESWYQVHELTETDIVPGKIIYKADDWKAYKGGKIHWKSPRFMPKKYARLFLEIDEVRVERLQDITDSDCETEGVRPSIDGDAKDWRENESGWKRTFRQLWDSINFKHGYCWDENPWVWVIKFHVIQKES